VYKPLTNKVLNLKMVVLARDHCGVVQALTAARKTVAASGNFSDDEDSDSPKTEPKFEKRPPTLYERFQVATDHAKQKLKEIAHNTIEYGETVFNKQYTPSYLPHKKEKVKSDEYENDAEDEPRAVNLHLEPYGYNVFTNFGSAYGADKSVFDECYGRINEDNYKSIFTVDVSGHTFEDVPDFLALVKQAVNANLFDHLRYTNYNKTETFDEEGDMNDYEFYAVHKTNSKHEHKSLTRIAHKATGARLVTKLVVPTNQDFDSIDSSNASNVVVVGDVRDTSELQKFHSRNAMFPHVYGVFGIEAHFNYEGTKAVAMCSLIVMRDLTSFNHEDKIKFDGFVYNSKKLDSHHRHQIEKAFYSISEALRSKKIRPGLVANDDFAIVRHKHIISGAHSYKIYRNALELEDLYQ